MNDSTSRYQGRFERVLDHIERHLGEALTVEQLAAVAGFSKFHFHRQFSAYVGTNVARYVQGLRLQRACYRLVFEEARIIDIALDAGFENPESFSRAFKQQYGLTPSRFRKEPAWTPWNQRLRRPTLERSTPMQVEIIHFPETPVAVLEHRGSPERVHDSVRTFIDWRKSSGRSPVNQRDTFGIPYDDPANVAPEQFRFDICGAVRSPVAENPQGVVNKAIPAGRCAVVRHLGSLDRVDETVYYLFRQWLPRSGEELRDFPVFFHYRTLMPFVEEHELVTDVHLPLK
ncbi:AraC family transcriptional regulator [Endothiovibrio diazotrophicus]